jgi:hypothetical protein
MPPKKKASPLLYLHGDRGSPPVLPPWEPPWWHRDREKSDAEIFATRIEKVRKIGITDIVVVRWIRRNNFVNTNFLCLCVPLHCTTLQRVERRCSRLFCIHSVEFLTSFHMSQKMG